MSPRSVAIDTMVAEILRRLRPSEDLAYEVEVLLRVGAHPRRRKRHEARDVVAARIGSTRQALDAQLLDAELPHSNALLTWGNLGALLWEWAQGPRPALGVQSLEEHGLRYGWPSASGVRGAVDRWAATTPHDWVHHDGGSLVALADKLYKRHRWGLANVA